MKQLILKLLSPVLGKKATQSFFTNLYNISLKGMNCGTDGDYRGSGELNVIRTVASKLAGVSKPVVFDVGANVGGYAKMLAENIPSATIHSFEPSVATYEMFTKATKHLPNVIANNFGMGEEVSTLELFTNFDGSGLASVYNRQLDHHGVAMTKSEKIEISTIDEYCQQKGIEHIHFLKLDIEGHEVKALNGAKKMLSESLVDFIQFEFGGCNIDSGTYYRDFYNILNKNYRIFRVLKNGLAEVVGYRESNEIFVNTNYFAERR